MRIQENIKADKLLRPSKASLLQNLKMGDVLQGTVKQLYPNQRAAIQIQGNQLIAQLEASLSVGGRYFFQVTSNEGNMPELKVMTGEQQNKEQMISNLLQQLGIKENRLTSQLVNALAREQVPMQRSDLMQAVQYIQDNKIPPRQAMPVLMQLMKMRIPVTQASFQAVQALQNGNISAGLASLDRSLPPGKQSMLQVNLEHVLRGFPSEQSAVRAVLTADAQTAKPVLFPLLQNLGFVSKALDKQSWSNILQQWNTQAPPNAINQAASTPPFTAGFEKVTEQIRSILANQQLLMSEARAQQQGNNKGVQMRPNLEAQFPQYFSSQTPGNEGNARQVTEALSEPKNYQTLERFMNILGTSNERAVKIVLTADTQAAKPALFPLLQDLGIVSKSIGKQGWINALQQWNPPAGQSQGTITTPFTGSFEGVKEQIQSILGNQKQLMAEAKVLHGAMIQGNNTAALPKAHLTAEFPQYFSNHAPVAQESENTVRSLMEALTEPKNYQALERLLNIWKASNEHMIHNPKEQFLQQMQWVLRDAGLNAENSLKTDDANSMQFKHLLLEMLQNTSSGIGRENAQQVVHFLNGMQLNNINESSYFIQTNLQIPGQKLGVSKDIGLHFEGKKTADGSIDPEHCRIIFDLQLHRMKETIVDLHVQKNSLAITIYNDQATTPMLVDKLRPNLQEALEKMNYQVASIICKPYTEIDKQQLQSTSALDENPEQGGVDFRI
ncbi:hypothetical protein [Oceanobacillus jeddahense]|uniref:hypothetical protein n=1 Tax=Oceanobacillus jeddahense TaxID=1462527 RepID=UPI0005961F9D|nr:hypothetical protein [Oceanobacillus jeddahense]